jgi:hypothetical protein
MAQVVKHELNSDFVADPVNPARSLFVAERLCFRVGVGTVVTRPIPSELHEQCHGAHSVGGRLGFFPFVFLFFFLVLLTFEKIVDLLDPLSQLLAGETWIKGLIDEIADLVEQVLLLVDCILQFRFAGSSHFFSFLIQFRSG